MIPCTRWPRTMLRFPALRFPAMVLLAGFVQGCGGGSAPPPAQSEVVLWHSMGDDLGRVLNEIVSRFNQGRTGPKVVPRYQGDYNLLKQKIHMSLKAGNSPDMTQQYESWTAYYNLEKGNEGLVPLDDFIKADASFDIQDIFPVFIADNTWDGKIWTFPCTKSLPVLYYNREIFTKAGLDPDRPPKTWKEFAEFGRKLTKDLDGDGNIDQWGWSYVVDPWIVECMVLQQGAKLAESDSNILPFDREEYAHAVSFYRDATLGDTPYATKSSGYEFQNDFIAQHAAMIITSSVSKSFMIDRIRFDFAMAPLPYWTQNATIISGTNIGIFASTSPENRQVAWDFIRFFSSTDIAALWAIRTGYVPVRRSSVESEAFKEHIKRDPTALAAIEQIDVAQLEPRSPVWYEVRDQVAKAIEKVLLGEGTVEGNLKWATERMRETMKKAPAGQAP